jgi:hypothetical protein
VPAPLLPPLLELVELEPLVLEPLELVELEPLVLPLLELEELEPVLLPLLELVEPELVLLPLLELVELEPVLLPLELVELLPLLELVELLPPLELLVPSVVEPLPLPSEDPPQAERAPQTNRRGMVSPRLIFRAVDTGGAPLDPPAELDLDLSFYTARSDGASRRDPKTGVIQNVNWYRSNTGNDAPPPGVCGRCSNTAKSQSFAQKSVAGA